MKKAAPVKIKLYIPTTDAGRQELKRRVSNVHADFAAQQIRGLDCPVEQKLALADAILAARALI